MDEAGDDEIKLFVAVVFDGYYPPSVRIFSTPIRAVDWARTRFREMMGHPDEIRETFEHPSGQFWVAGWGEQEGHAWVERAVPDKED